MHYATTSTHGWSFLFSWWGGCPTNFVLCHTNSLFATPIFDRFWAFPASKWSCWHYAIPWYQFLRLPWLIFTVFAKNHRPISFLPHQLCQRSSTHASTRWIQLYLGYHNGVVLLDKNLDTKVVVQVWLVWRVGIDYLQISRRLLVWKMYWHLNISFSWQNNIIQTIKKN